jgi:hypothetical protein
MRCHLHHVITQTKHRLVHSTVIKDEEPFYVLFSQIMSYILHIMIYIGMILLDNMFQCILFIVVIDFI